MLDLRDAASLLQPRSDMHASNAKNAATAAHLKLFLMIWYLNTLSCSTSSLADARLPYPDGASVPTTPWKDYSAA